MFFSEDIDKRFSNACSFNQKNNVQIINLKYAVICGIRGIASYSEEKVEIKLNKSFIAILGNSLKIIAVSEDEIYIEGDITSFNVLKI